MVSVRQLYEIDQRLRQIFFTDEEFGGRSIIVVGHLRQLPPVAASHVFKEPKHLPLGLCVGNQLWPKHQLYELDEIMRQKGDLEFCKALNNMAEGCMDDEDIALIKSRQITPDNQPPAEAIRLFAVNAQCQQYNSEVHKRLNTNWEMSTAYDKIQGNGSQAQKKAQLEYAKTLTREKSDGLPYETRLQVGAEYFVSTNVDVQDGLFNGSTGCLKKIDCSFTPKNIKIPTRAWMDFRNPLIGVTQKSKTRSYQVRKKIDLNWVAVGRITRNLSKSGRQGLQIIRTQIPLVGANAMTIAKAQGSSLPLVVVNVNPWKRRKLTRELLYVACSRATSCAGLFIDGEFEPPAPPPANDAVTLEMMRNRNHPLVFHLRFLQDYSDQYEKIYFHNVQSFILHYLDVVADPCAMNTNILAFVEPHLLATDSFSITNFHCIHRSNCRQGRNSEGALIFAREKNDNYCVTKSTDFTSNGHCIFVKWLASSVNVVMTYKSPNYPIKNFVREMAKVLGTLNDKILVFGDININLQNEGVSIKALFEQFNLKSELNINDPSTDGGSHIDCCFSNVQNLTAWFYECDYSYHKPICMVFPKL